MDKNQVIDIKKNPIEYKKSRLLEHIPFITEVIARVEGTGYEHIWETMYNCIMNDKKV